MDAVPGERTALAWQRTGWTALGVGALVLHAVPGWPGVVAGVVLLVGGVSSSVLVAPWRMRAVAVAGATGAAAPTVVATAMAVVVLVGVLAVGAIVLG